MKWLGITSLILGVLGFVQSTWLNIFIYLHTKAAMSSQQVSGGDIAPSLVVIGASAKIPVLLLGLISIVLGIIAISNNYRALGSIGIGLSILAIIMVFIPIVTLIL